MYRPPNSGCRLATAPLACPRGPPEGPSLSGCPEAPGQNRESSGLAFLWSNSRFVLRSNKSVCPVSLSEASISRSCFSGRGLSSEEQRAGDALGVLPGAGRRRCRGVQRKRGLRRRTRSARLSRRRVSWPGKGAPGGWENVSLGRGGLYSIYPFRFTQG